MHGFQASRTLSADRRSAGGDQGTGGRLSGRQPDGDPARRDRLRKDLHDGECHSAAPEADAHNKTLAAQLYGEFKEFFPENAVEYFVSYYDYYQPEAYVPQTDTYIEKDSMINDEIDKLRM